MTLSQSPDEAPGLGTFEGVFTPSILTILGVIMYLRLGWVVGNVGLASTLLIVTLAIAITALTALSVSAIATDSVVRVGGAYYMISRTLGVETGGAIGLPLYFAQSLSVALYTVGFAESLVGVFPRLNATFVGIGVTLAVGLLAWKSARFALRAQYFVMGAIALSLISLALGSSLTPGPAASATTAAAGGAPDTASFWVVFAVFFPAVTGIMAGVNMSGDLADPSRSIPRGTFAAIGTGYLIYMTLPVILFLRADLPTLIEDPLVMRRIALWGDAILLGVWGATLSSAVGSILGAPRVLQALALDGVLPSWLRFLGAGSGDADEPRVGTIVTLGVALVAVALGNLNVIAPVLTMFFLTTYLVLNLAAGLERVLDSPSFRPAFRVHWSLSLLGAGGCLVVMFLINPLATVVAAGLILLVYIWLQRREMRVAWGDVRKGIWMALVRAGLLRVRGPADAKNWRPHLLVLSGAPTKRWHLVEIASALTHNRGLLTVASVVPPHQFEEERRSNLEAAIQEFLARKGIQGFVRLVTAPDPFSGAENLVEAYGLGSLVPNTIFIGDSEVDELRDRYCRLIANMHRSQRNVVILRDPEDTGFGERRRIDLWWGGLHRNGGLMMLLAYLLKTSVGWNRASLQVNLVVPDQEAAEGAEMNLEKIVHNLRIGARSRVLVAKGRSFGEILRETSAGADLVMLGMAEPGAAYRGYYEGLQEMTAGLPPTLLVLAAEELAFSAVLLEEGAGR
jgi:amino acid transporter